MSAVWTAARAAVRRRRLQTVVIWLVTLVSTGVIVVALGLMEAASGPFDKVFGQQRGPHVVASFDREKVSDTQLAAVARESGAEAFAGPYERAVVTLADDAQNFGLGDEIGVVGRRGPGGPVDRVDLWAGRWATGPGEVVLNRQSDWTADDLGKRLRLPSGEELTVVGFAFDLSRTADAWVAPGRMPESPTRSFQMLFRFDEAATDAQLRSGLGQVTRELPEGSLLGSESYLALKERIGGSARAFTQYLMVFGILGLVVSVLIVAHVVSGAVISGFRHIGVLKALGFTPGQVLAVYLIMVSVPAVTGCVLGTVAGHLLAGPFFEFVFTGPDAGVFHDAAGITPWVNAVTLLGMPGVCVLAALAPALRARKLSAARAISAGAAPRAGRALGLQRRLAGSRLPRAVSLGIGLPFARPGRSALTVAAVGLGVTTVTFAVGLAATLTSFGNASSEPYQVTVYATRIVNGEEHHPTHGDRELEALLGTLSGARQITARGNVMVHIAGSARSLMLEGRRGPTPGLSDMLVEGRWPRGGGEVVATSAFLRQNRLDVGDRFVLERGDRRQSVVITGESLSNVGDRIMSDWSTLTFLAPGTTPIAYHVWLGRNADPAAYARAARAADPGIDPVRTGSNTLVQTIVGSATALTVMLSLVAALGVFNTVVLNTRDRRRDLGVLKSVGMTPRQVTAMTVTSMALLGAAGSLLGVPLGVAGHQVVVPRMTEAVDMPLPDSMRDVWHLSVLAWLAPAGVVIAVLGAWIPALRVGRLRVAEVLRNE